MGAPSKISSKTLLHHAVKSFEMTQTLRLGKRQKLPSPPCVPVIGLIFLEPITHDHCRRYSTLHLWSQHLGLAAAPRAPERYSRRRCERRRFLSNRAELSDSPAIRRNRPLSRRPLTRCQATVSVELWSDVPFGKHGPAF